MEKQKQMIYVWLHPYFFPPFYSAAEPRATCTLPHFILNLFSPQKRHEASNQPVILPHVSPSRHLSTSFEWLLCPAVRLFSLQGHFNQKPHSNPMMTTTSLFIYLRLWRKNLYGQLWLEVLVVTLHVQWIYFHASSWESTGKIKRRGGPLKKGDWTIILSHPMWASQNSALPEKPVGHSLCGGGVEGGLI